MESWGNRRSTEKPKAEDLKHPLPRMDWLGPLLLVLWGQLYLAAIPAWRFGDYYDYGWYVPPLAVWFCWVRIRSHAGPLRAPAGGAWMLPLIALPPLLLVLRVMERVDPRWTLPIWLHAMLVVAVSHSVLAMRMDWRSSLRFLPLTAFALSAIPLPTIVESRLVHGLTDWVVASTTWLFQWVGKPVTAAGDLLFANGTTVRVAEDCSGIRSIQSFLMSSLFFGEWMRLSLVRRGLMVLAGVAIAWFMNILRAFLLGQIGFTYGQEALDRWHDPLGLFAFVAGAGVLLALAHYWDDGKAAVKTPFRLPAGLWRRWARAAIFPLLLVAGIEGLAFLWLRPPAAGKEMVRQIPFYAFPVHREDVEMDAGAYQAIERKLRSDRGLMGRIVPEHGPRIQIACLEWEGGDMGSTLEAFRHLPEECMGSIGLRLRKHHPDRLHRLGETTLVFDSTEFSARWGDSPYFVFKAVWMPGDAMVHLRDGPSKWENRRSLREIRMAAAMRRFTPDLARVFMFTVSGVPTEALAWSVVRDEILPDLRLVDACSSPGG